MKAYPCRARLSARPLHAGKEAERVCAMGEEALGQHVGEERQGRQGGDRMRIVRGWRRCRRRRSSWVRRAAEESDGEVKARSLSTLAQTTTTWSLEAWRGGLSGVYSGVATHREGLLGV